MLPSEEMTQFPCSFRRIATLAPSICFSCAAVSSCPDPDRANVCRKRVREAKWFPLGLAKAALRPTSAYFKESSMLRFIGSLSRDERGVSSLEYAILAGIVVVALVSVGTVIQSNTNGIPSLFTALMNKITGAI
jgi:pilus assembly protein Flp/PilA